jgi:ribA/ribD-fused uncharacterized protein
MVINEFKGKYRFLSNFYKTPVEYEGKIYPSSENAFQAAKSLDDKVRDKFLKIEPSEAKKLGREIELRPNWDQIKMNIMYNILKAKFSDPKMKQLLLSTKDAILIEGNDWGDTFWGYNIKRGYGHNYLGRFLMRIRMEIDF